VAAAQQFETVIEARGDLRKSNCGRREQPRIQWRAGLPSRRRQIAAVARRFYLVRREVRAQPACPGEEKLHGTVDEGDPAAHPDAGSVHPAAERDRPCSPSIRRASRLVARTEAHGHRRTMDSANLAAASMTLFAIVENQEKLLSSDGAGNALSRNLIAAQP